MAHRAFRSTVDALSDAHRSEVHDETIGWLHRMSAERLKADTIYALAWKPLECESRFTRDA